MEAPFIWQVADSGYTLQQIKGSTWLMYDPETNWTEYQPLQKYTGLFRQFAELNGQDELLRFANRYGLLGIPMDLRGIASVNAGRGTVVLRPELLADWNTKIIQLRAAVRLWDAIQRPDHGYLKQVINWKKNPKRVSYEDDHLLQTIRNTHTDGSQIKFGELLWPAYYYIQERINDALKDSVAPRMLWHENQLQLFHVPKSLLGAMWLQFADAVTYELEFRACAWCGKSFEVTLSTRSDRQYCSNSCRVSASRKRTSSAKRKQP